MKTHACGAVGPGGLVRALLRWALRRPRDALVAEFGRAFAATIGVPPESVRVFGSGRAALHALVSALDLKPDAEILLPGYTCAVVPNVFAHLGLPVRYVDIDDGAVNPGADALSAAIGPRTAVVVLAHNFGIATPGVEALRTRHPAVVFVEDAAHAWGSRAGAHGRALGTLAQAGFFSFEYAKPLTTALGGALVVRDAQLAARLDAHDAGLRPPGPRALVARVATMAYHLSVARLAPRARTAIDALLRAPARALGLVAGTDAAELAAPTGPAAADYRLALHPLQAAIGLIQLENAANCWRERHEQALVYDRALAGATRVRLLPRGEHDLLLRYPVVVQDPADRDLAARELSALGIEPGRWFDDVVHPRGSHRHGYTAGDCPHGEALARRMLNLPLGLHARLSARQLRGLAAWGRAA